MGNPLPIRRMLSVLMCFMLAGCASTTLQPTTIPATITPTNSAPPTATFAPTATTVPATPMAQPAVTPSPTPDPDADYVPAMRPGFGGDIALAGNIPRYTLDIWLMPASRVLTGTEHIRYTNRADAPLSDIALRLYPNFPADVFGKGGDVQMDVTGAAANGQPIAPRYAAQRTAVLLQLPEPLAPGAATTLAISFTASMVPWRDGSWPLPSYYPMLAVRENGAWRLDVTRFADHVYAESAIYAASITAPSSLTIVATGSTIAATPHADGTTTHEVRTGPVREFALTAGTFAHTTANAGNVPVHVYTARGTRLDTAQIAGVAAAALADFDTRFGAYPYAELDIQLLPYEYDGGDEFPGLILLYSGGAVGPGTRYVAAHEVAHQWWYGIVGNDIYRQPWLDEALAQYSGIIYAEDVAGPATASADWQREVVRRYNGARADGDLPVGWAITNYPSFNVYYRTVYGKGPVFLRTLREQIGDDVFFSALRQYYQQNRYGIGTTAALERAFEAAARQPLGPLFAQWVGSAAP